MPAHIRNFVHKALHLSRPTLLSVETIDRPTVTLAVAPLLSPSDPLEELHPFIEEDALLPTIVYVDDRLDCKELAVEHRLLLRRPENTAEGRPAQLI